MPDAIITSTASTFGTITGTFEADQSTVIGTITGIVAGTLDGSVGVPGPTGSQGPAGSQGPQGVPGVPGAPGQGVPVGGTAGQFLQKTSGVDYATDWVTLNLSGLATESWVTAGFYPLTGNPSGFLTASALTPYLTSATAASTYQTLAGMSAYLTTSAAAAGYYPLTGNPSGFLTSASLSGYATESWVTGQGYITSAALTPYLTSSTAAATYQTLAGMSDYAQLSGATFTGNVFAPTPSPGTDSTRIATTEWVKNFDYAPTNSPHFTGNPQSVTPNLSDNDTSIATTAFVKGQAYLTSSALTGYATESWVTAGFYPLTGNPSGFLTSSALTPYLTIASASATYQTIAGMSSYLTTSAAASTYQTISGMSSYLTTTAAAATYQTQAAMASYATESWVTSQGYLTDAPSDGNQYARKDGAWDIVSGGGSSYITSVTSPLAVTSGDLSIDLTGYATESWVTSQGYITSVGFYPLTQDLGYDTSSADGRLLIDGIYDPSSSGYGSARVNFGSTTPPGAIDGDLWSNGTNFRYKLGGTTQNIASESYVTTRGYITSSALSSYAPLASPALTGVPTAPTASLGTNTTQIATTAFVIANAGGGGGGGGVDVQSFGSSTTSGTFTWTKPAGAKYIEVHMWGGGGGGGGGAVYPTTSIRTGGGGGGGGGYAFFRLHADTVPSTVNVVIAPGRAGGAGRSGSDGNGTAGSGSSVDTTFNIYRIGTGNSGGGGGTTTSTGGSGGYSRPYVTENLSSNGGGCNTSGAPSTGANIGYVWPTTGGGSGAGATANITTNRPGAQGGNILAGSGIYPGTISAYAGGAAGSIAGVLPTTGVRVENNILLGATGGGGGAYRTGVNGMNGADGGWPGGGGGGGGAADSGFSAGSGGKGGNGAVTVITYF
jgi:hypothetical protein